MFGKTLVIINPTARSGKATEIAAKASVRFSELLEQETENPELTLYHTVSEKDATRAARELGSLYNTIIAIGGDGVVHEVANGLMQLPAEARPQFGIIPCGNGDDFARSLMIDRNPVKSLEQIASAHIQNIDVGKVNDEFYLETLSFGLDAAIALETMDLRKKTGRTGTSLYLQCGINQLFNHLDIHTCTMKLDDKEPEMVQSYLLAVQNGITYGGGFKISPDAKLDDGLFNICYVKPPLSSMKATVLFLSAKNGGHVGHPQIVSTTASKVSLDFKNPVPAQVDGEPIYGTHFDVSLIPGALKVLSCN